MTLEAIGETTTCEKATNEGLFKLSPEEAYCKLGGSLEDLRSKDIVYSVELHYEISGVYSECPECGTEIQIPDMVCSGCGFNVWIEEQHDTREGAEKSKHAVHFGIIEKVTFWAKVRSEPIDDFKLEG